VQWFPPKLQHRYSDDGRVVKREPVTPSDLVAFRCDVLYSGEHAIVVARGAVDVDTAPQLLRQVSATVPLPITGVSLDLSYVTRLDGSGAAALVAARQVALEHGVSFRLESVSREARRTLERLELLDLFGLSPRSDAWVPPTIQGGAAA
jgi:anti-anti-sigma factor